MSHTFVIAEAGSCHDNSFTKALRLIDAAKECGADACKFQFWSHPGKLAARRGLGPDAKAVYERYQLPSSWLPRLKDHCDESGVEFMVTSYLIEDIEVIAPYVKTWKVSAYESQWSAFLRAHGGEKGCEKPLIVSVNPDQVRPEGFGARLLHCISEYPTPVERLQLKYLGNWTNESLRTGQRIYRGISDHTTSTLTGALAVAAGASIVEKHVKLIDTKEDNPDFGHSLYAGADVWPPYHMDFMVYVGLIRQAERAM